MDKFTSMFTHAVCFLKIIHTPSCKSLLYRGVIAEFVQDFHKGDHKFLIKHNAHAVDFLDELRFDPSYEIDFIDYFLHLSQAYPFLVQLSTAHLQKLKFNEQGEVISSSFSKKTQNQWVWVKSLEQASKLAIEFSEQVHTNDILEEKYPL